ncbi:hypothetical protein pb186bvf_012611 [Paramecium bursaria]
MFLKTVLSSLIIFQVLGINEHRTLRGALTLLQQAEFDETLLQSQKPKIIVYADSAIENVQIMLQPLLNNKLSQNVEFFNSLPTLLLFGALIPVSIVFLISLGIYLMITPRRNDKQYVSLKKPEKNNQEYPPQMMQWFL